MQIMYWPPPGSWNEIAVGIRTWIQISVASESAPLSRLEGPAKGQKSWCRSWYGNFFIINEFLDSGEKIENEPEKTTHLLWKFYSRHPPNVLTVFDFIKIPWNGTMRKSMPLFSSDGSGSWQYLTCVWCVYGQSWVQFSFTNYFYSHSYKILQISEKFEVHPLLDWTGCFGRIPGLPACYQRRHHFF